MSCENASEIPILASMIRVLGELSCADLSAHMAVPVSLSLQDSAAATQTMSCIVLALLCCLVHCKSQHTAIVLSQMLWTMPSCSTCVTVAVHIQREKCGP